MAAISLTRSERAFGANNRRALTLIEIMASILVLAVGLVGVLAAIPFGGMRLAQMNEADNCAAMGRNAVRLMKTNGWTNPSNWLLKNQQNGSYPSTHNAALYDTGNLNLTYPFFIDPLGKTTGEYFPEFYDYKPSNGFEVFFTRMAPMYDFSYSSLQQDARYERDFYLNETISGYSESEDETEVRPRVETEPDMVLNVGDIPSFSGRHSWLATVSLKTNSDAFFDCSLSSIGAADYSVAVFQDRIVDDEKVFTATLNGSGYQGGVVTVDLTTGRTSSTNNTYLKTDERANDAITRSRVVEQLETTRYIMLFGQEDLPEDGNYRAFAKWYQIANYSVVERDDDGAPKTLRMNLVGENTPKSWTNGSLKISALFFPGVIGVYSGTTTF